MQREVVLDEKSFKALSADSRVSILKNLNERRMTLSELSSRLNLEASTIKEHCNVLSGADLIKQIDEGRKWKYYELTSKGKSILQPSLMDEVKVLIVLCLGILIFGGILFMAMGTNIGSASVAAGENHSVLKTTASTDNAFNTVTGAQGTAPQTEAQTCTPKEVVQYKTDYSTTITAALFALIIGFLIGWTIKRKY